ncbi:DUF4279 domain-containing protein [Roseateles sp. BYS180W]|uniref:DUF4279 domain-containing protein n=1 Tax=Roseateles rivi TaxID=3299028 RepID=A0ABW7FX67_9BURK
MSTSNKKVMVGLYLKGDDLEPQQITESIGIVPTISHGRGEAQRTTSGREFVTKTGVWGFVIDEDPAEVVDVVASLIAALGQHKESLANLPQVQEAYIDVFVAADSDEDGEGTCEMALTALQVKVLSSYGLPIRFTVSMGKP